MYYCQGDGGQWNVKVTIVQPIPGTMLKVIRAEESGTLNGLLGSDGHVYTVAPDCDLYDKPQD
jgi:hypothetical protein